MGRRTALVSLAVGACAMSAAFAGRRLWISTRRPARPAGTIQRGPVGAIYPVAPNLYVVPDGGANTAVFVTESGVLLVDPKWVESWDALMAQVRTVTAKPITHVVNTHCHGDHAGSNVRVPDSAEIIVQANTAANLDKMSRAAQSDNDSRRSLRTFEQRLTLFAGEDAVDLYYFGPAHTNGDAFVVFRAAGVMLTGDVFSDKVAPVINIEWGGNGATYAETLARAVADIPNVARVISGHGPVYTWADFVEYAEFNRLLLDYVRTNMRFGKDKNRVFNAFRPPDRFKDYSLGRTFDTMDEIDRSLRPRWQRVWSRGR